MSLLSFISELFKPAAQLVDELITSDEERLKLQNELFEMKSKLTMQALEYELKLTQAKASVITAEANGNSWLQRSWRPISMLVFLGLVVMDTLGLTAFRLAPQAWDLLQIGIGGYVIGRSAEKVATPVTQAIKEKLKGG